MISMIWSSKRSGRRRPGSPPRSTMLVVEGQFIGGGGSIFKGAFKGVASSLNISSSGTSMLGSWRNSADVGSSGRANNEEDSRCAKVLDMNLSDY